MLYCYIKLYCKNPKLSNVYCFISKSRAAPAPHLFVIQRFLTTHSFLQLEFNIMREMYMRHGEGFIIYYIMKTRTCNIQKFFWLKK